jgi:hypothetical protein
MKHTPFRAFILFIAVFFLASCYPFNISLKPEQGSLNVTFIISGTITKSDGGNAAGASVQLKQNGFDVGSSVLTNADGTYTIGNVFAGTYTIEVSLTGYVTDAISAFTVSNANVTGKDLVLQISTPVYSVSGTITKNNGGNAVGASVQLKQDGSDVGSSVSTNADGTYTIGNVAAGTYTIEVSLPGYNTGAISAFTVSNADVTGKDLELQKTISSLNLGAYTGDYTAAYAADGTTIKSITTDAETILIGRPDTDNIELNLDAGGSLDFRPADSGSIPIGSYAEFQLINTTPGALAGNYRQEADLNLMGEEWTPVGNDSTPFTGTFDGDGKHIDNLKINTPGTNDVGLFGYVNDGMVENVHVRSGNVTGGDWVSGVAGHLKGGAVVRDSSNAASISGITGVGGVAGRTDYYPQVSIIACFNTGNVAGTYGVGGVVGVLNYDAVIACYNTGAVSGTSDIAPGDSQLYGVGGIVGCMWTVLGLGQLTACYNAGSVTSSNGDDHVGSIAGRGTIPATAANYWKSGTAVKGIGIADTDTPIQFSGTAWPSAGENAEWGTGDGSGSGKYWKTLGGWNGGSPVYPKLWYEP